VAGGNEFTHRELSWIPDGASGGDLARRAVTQAQRFGVEILSPQEATGIRTEGSYRIIKLADGNELSCYALMIANWRAVAEAGCSGDSTGCRGRVSTMAAAPRKRCPAKEKSLTLWVAQIRGPGRDEFLEVCGTCGDPGAGKLAGQHDVAVSNRPDPGKTQHSDLVTRQHRRGARRDPSGGDSVLCTDTGNVERVPASSMFIFYWSATADGLAGDMVERDARGFNSSPALT